MKKIPTEKMSREEWIKLRKTGIGGSDAGAVCGLNPYRSPFTVYMDKTSEEVSEDDNEAMRQGRDFEDYVAKRFTEETGLKVQRSNYLYRSEEYPFMLANIDRQIIGENGGLECKTASAYAAEKWKDGKIPESYELQCQHYMAVMGWDHMYIACLILGREFLYRRIERDDQLIRNLIRIEKEFWEEHVLKHVLPDPDGSRDYDTMLEEYFKRESRKDEAIPLIGFDQDLRRRQEISELLSRLEEERNEIDQRLKLYMKDKEVAMNQDYKVSWIYTETTRLDTKRLKEEEPEVYRRYAKMSTGRRFSVKGGAA